MVSLDGEEVDGVSLLEERQTLPGQLALTIAALFTGAAIYINIAEQPARLQLDDSSLLAEWKLAYSRGYMMQASFAIAGGFFGVVAFFSTFEWRWLLGAAVLPLKLALHDVRDDADQSPPDEHTGGRCHD